MRGSKKFCQRVSKFDNVFFFIYSFFYEGRREDVNTPISGSSSPRQWNASADDGPTLTAGLVAL